MPSVCWWLIFALVLPFGYNVMTKWRFAMKTFSLSSSPARPQRLWQVAGLNNADGVALWAKSMKAGREGGEPDH